MRRSGVFVNVTSIGQRGGVTAGQFISVDAPAKRVRELVQEATVTVDAAVRQSLAPAPDDQTPDWFARHRELMRSFSFWDRPEPCEVCGSQMASAHDRTGTVRLCSDCARQKALRRPRDAWWLRLLRWLASR